MKLATYKHRGRQGFGAVKDDTIIDLAGAAGGRWSNLASLVRDEGFEAAERAAQNSQATFPLEAVELLPPIPEPGKIICIGLNYRTHIAETGRDTPEFPMLFARYPDSLVGHGHALVRPLVSSKFDFEGELAVVIGRTARHVPVEKALEFVAGYSCFNDGSIRDYQRHTTQFLPGKTFWRSGAFGPWLVTADEVGALSDLQMTTRLNGEIMQRAPVSDLLFGVAELIAYISAITPLSPGDVIATGTTGGVGAARKPPVWMRPGDTVEVEISRVGTLINRVIGEEKLLARQPAESAVDALP